MKKDVRTVCRDSDLNLEAYRFEGVVQPFPNHFHDYYVIGLVEEGIRSLVCKNREYTVRQGNLLLFNPNDSHGCTQSGNTVLDYKGLNIPAGTMNRLTEEITGSSAPYTFSQNVIFDEDISLYLRALHQMIMDGGEKLEKEEMLFLFITLLLERYGQPFENGSSDYRREIELACAFMEENYSEHISLEQLCTCCGLSKSTLLRAFTKSKGVTPYRYLQSIRIGKAKSLLENGSTPAEAALHTGFNDQSHFTNFFHMFIGMSPAAYRRICGQDNVGDQYEA